MYDIYIRVAQLETRGITKNIEMIFLLIKNLLVNRVNRLCGAFVRSQGCRSASDVLDGRFRHRNSDNCLVAVRRQYSAAAGLETGRFLVQVFIVCPADVRRQQYVGHSHCQRRQVSSQLMCVGQFFDDCFM